jgi:methylsterol monooxygenase
VRRLRLVPFLVKLVLARLVADVTFYVLHRALHTRALYGRLHKRHHEHKAPGLHTNFHFTAADLLIEGALPIVAALASLKPLLGTSPKPVELGLLHVCLQWYEIGSHSGKPVPTVSYLPPLAPLYRAILGDVDRRNVEFHHAHHQLTHCNYGITQWLDHALGTARLAGSHTQRAPASRSS